MLYIYNYLYLNLHPNMSYGQTCSFPVACHGKLARISPGKSPHEVPVVWRPIYLVNLWFFQVIPVNSIYIYMCGFKSLNIYLLCQLLSGIILQMKVNNDFVYFCLFLRGVSQRLCPGQCSQKRVGSWWRIWVGPTKGNLTNKICWCILRWVDKRMNWDLTDQYFFGGWCMVTMVQSLIG